MNNPFDVIEEKLCNIESMLYDLKQYNQESIQLIEHKCNIGFTEEALKEIEPVETHKQYKTPISVKWLKDLIVNLSNEKSSICKTIKLLTGVTDYIIKLIDTYNKWA